MKLLLGTKNKGKIEEVKRILGDLPNLSFLTYEEIPFSDVIEDGKTYAENSFKKASSVSKEKGLPVLAEDSGLEVSALDGRPGVKSSRYAGENASDKENNSKLLEELREAKDRSARFVSVATLFISGDNVLQEEGVMDGKIVNKPRGSSGFGYDPLFAPDGYEGKTVAQLGEEVKNEISHRKKALEKIREKLKKEIK